MDLVKFANKSTDYDLAFKQEKCLRKYKTTECDKCFQSCPQEAIKLEDKSISFEENKCNNCGTCLTTCPSYVFEADPPITITCINNIDKQKIAIFACENSMQKNALQVSCLAGLSSAALVYGALKTGSAVLVIDQCADCSLFEKAKSVINKNVDDANAILDCVENNKSKVSMVDSPFLIDRHISRGDFFNTVKATLIDIGLETVMEKLGRENKRLSDTDILMHVLGKQKLKKEVSELPFFTLGLNGSCNYCLKCASICPTEAVYSVVEDKKIKLVFESKKCHGCNLCIEACPNNCISISNKTDLNIVNKELVLDKSKANFCQTCSELIPTDKTRCPKCIKKESMSKQIQELF